MALDVGVLGNLQTPNLLGSVGSLVNTAQGIQNLRSQQLQQTQMGQQIESAGIALQVQRQANVERQLTMKLLSNSQARNPDGSFNTDWIAATAPGMGITQTLPDLLSNTAKTNVALSSGKDSILNLNTKEAGFVGQAMFDPSSDWSSPASVVKNLDDIRDTLGPQGKPLIDLITGQIKGVQGAPFTDEAKQQKLNSLKAFWTNWYLSAQQQQEKNLQTYGTYNAGTKVYGYGQKAGIPNQPQGSPAAPTWMAGVGTGPQIMTDAAGNLHKVSGIEGSAPMGLPPIPGVPTTVGQNQSEQVAPQKPVSSAPASNTSPLPHPSGRWISPVPNTPAQSGAWTNQSQAASQAQAGAETKAAQQGALQIPVLRNNISQLFRLADSGTKFGPGSDFYNQSLGLANMMSGGSIGAEAAKYQTATALLDRIALQQAQAMGQTTVSGTNLTAGATGTTAGFNKEALKEKLRIIDAQFAAQQAYTQGLMNHVGSGPQQNFGNKANYDAEWTKTLGTDGVDAFRIQSDLQRGDIADVDALIRASKKPLSYWKSRAMQIDNLTGGGLSGRARPPGAQ
jgi:hypothetical protein